MEVERGTQTDTCQVTANVLDADTPPPRETECLGATVTAAPGEEINLTSLACVSDNYPLTSVATVTPPGWTVHWAGDEDEIGASDTIGFRTTVPAAQAPGIYTFTNRIEDSTGTQSDLSVAVTVSADPSINIAAWLLNINREASRGFNRNITATGGPSAGNYVFAEGSGKPSWITFNTTTTNVLRLIAAPQNRNVSGSFTFTVTKGTSAPKTFRFTYQLRTDDDGEA